METVAPGAHGKGRQRRPEQGRGAQDAHFPDAEPERQQIGGQQHGDVAVAECAQRPANQQQPGFRRDAGGENHLRLSRRPIFFIGVSAHQA